MKLPELKTKLSQRLMLVFVSFIWGASFILIKKGLKTYDEFQVGNLRIFFAFLFLLPFFFKRLKKLKKEYIKPLLIVGFIGNLFPAILFAKAQTHIDSALASMINTLFPVVSLILGALFYGVKTEKSKITGIIVGLIGAFLLISNGKIEFSDENSIYALYIFIALIFYAISLYTIKYKLKELDGVTITIFAFALIGPFAGFSLFFTDLSSAMQKSGGLESMFYVILLALGSSAAAVTLFYHLTDYVDVVFASLITYIIPVFAIFWGLFDGEKITVLQIISMIIIFFGVYLVNKNGKKTSRNN